MAYQDFSIGATLLGAAVAIAVVMWRCIAELRSIKRHERETAAMFRAWRGGV